MGTGSKSLRTEEQFEGNTKFALRGRLTDLVIIRYAQNLAKSYTYAIFSPRGPYFSYIRCFFFASIYAIAVEGMSNILRDRSVCDNYRLTIKRLSIMAFRVKRRMLLP